MRHDTRLLSAALVLAALLVTPAATAHAQGWKGRTHVTFNAGGQVTTNDFTDRFTFERYVETGSTEVGYPVKAGLLIDGGGGVRLWKGLGAAVSISNFDSKSAADTTSQIPHPFFDNQPRTVEASTGDLERNERAVHVAVTYLIDPAGPLRVLLSAGPSFFSVEQEIVTAVQVAEQYPYDTATFTTANTRRSKDSATGFNVGIDAAWMFTRNLGAGGVVRYARASVDLAASDTRSVSTDAGGVHAGAGLRIVF